MTKKKVQYLKIPIKVKPYKHQRTAFDFVCGMFGLAKDSAAEDNSENEGGGAVENHQE